jgi:L-serine deaminase
MAFHIGVTSTGGLTLPSGAIAHKVDKSSKVGVSEVLSTAGEYGKTDSLRIKQVDLTISGVGPAGLAGVTAATLGAPDTMKILRAQQDEKSTGDLRANFTINATAMEAFDETAAGEGEGAGAAEPTADTLGIVSATFSLLESLSKTSEVKDVNVPDTDGTPGARGTCSKKNTATIRGRGDLPANITLGLAGMAIYGLTGGKTHVTQLDEGQVADDINSFGAQANHYPLAA